MRVLLIDVDSLRPDRLGCYGYDRETSPTIDGLAEEGVAFDQCFVSDSPCLPSRTALATCRHGAKTGVVTHYGSGQWYDEPGAGHAQDPARPLSFRFLSDNGLYTASISSFSKRHLAYHFGASFRESIQPTQDVGGEMGPDVTRVATDWIDRHADEDDWLLHVNYWDVHHPYEGVEEFVEPVEASGDPPDWPDQAAIDAQQGMTGFRTATSWPNAREYREGEYDEGRYEEWPFPVSVTDREDFEHLALGYDAAIRKVDAEVSRLLETLEGAGIREETTVVVTGDHGEAMGEHGIYTEHAFPHPPSQRVPMIVAGPQVADTASGERVDELVYQFDLLPTLCELTETRVPDAWDAEPFTAALTDGDFTGHEYLVCGQGIVTFGRAVYTRDWTYIRLLHPGVISHPGLYNDSDGEFGLELLHDRNEDPHMTENLVDEKPDVAREMRCRLDAWTARMAGSEDATGEDPLARMATTDGPYNYVEPVPLLDLYRELGHSDEKLETIRRNLRERPFVGEMYLEEIDPRVDWDR